MDRCEEYTDRQWLSYLLNRVGKEELARMQYHLLTCAACRERLERIRTLAGFLEDMELEDAEKLVDTEEKETGRQSSFSFKLPRFFGKKEGRALVAGICLFLLAGGYYYASYFTSRPSGPIPVEIREQPVYESVDTLRCAPDSMPDRKEKCNEKK